MSTAIATVTVTDMQTMAKAVAASGLFGMKTVEQALALMMISQAEGRHPALAARDYDIYQNKPAKKAEAMMRDFLQNGGSVKWHRLSDAEVDASFSHPQGGEVRIKWDMDRAKTAGISGKDNWRKYPRQMLRSRVVSEGIRTVCPMATSGMYVPEEVQDFDDKPQPVRDMGAAMVVEPEAVIAEEPSTITDAAKEVQSDLINEINGLCDIEELHAYWADNEEHARTSLPEAMYGQIKDQYEARAQQIARSIVDGGVSVGSYKFLNVAKMDAWLETAETELKRCDTQQELKEWREDAENRRRAQALEKRRKNILGDVVKRHEERIEKAQAQLNMKAAG